MAARGEATRRMGRRTLNTAGISRGFAANFIWASAKTVFRVSGKNGPDGGGWKMTDDTSGKMRVIKCGWKNAGDIEMRIEKCG